MKTDVSLSQRIFHEFSQRRIQLAIILVLTLLSYLPIFWNGFVWDDHDLIENWPEIRSWQNIPKFLTQATNPNYPDTYRPMRYVFSIFLYHLFGTNPMGYHVITLAVHLAVTILVYKLFGMLTTKKYVPFLGSLLFGIHPVHTEAITWISSGLDMTGIVLYLLSLIYALDTRNTNYRFISVLLATVAYFTLELTVTLPAVLLLCILSVRKQGQKTIPPLSVIPYVLSAFIYLFIRWRVVGITEVFGHLDGSVFQTVLVMARAFFVYLEVLVFPVRLTVNHVIAPGIPSFMVETGESFPTVLEAIRRITPGDPLVISSGLIIIGLCVLFVYEWKKNPTYSLAIGWFLVTLAPFSNLIPGHTIMAERYLYMPSVGFCLAIATLLSLGLEGKSLTKRMVVLLGIFSVVIACIYLSYSRNRVWVNDLTLMKQAADANPYSYIAHVGVAKQYLARNDYPAAIQEYRHVLTMYPEQKRVVGLLTELYIRTGRLVEARDLVRSVTVLRPDDVATWLKLGDIYRAMNDTASANAAYRQALTVDPNNEYARTRLQ